MSEKQLTDLVNENSDHYYLLNLLADFYRTNKLYGKAIKYYDKLFYVVRIP